MTGVGRRDDHRTSIRALPTAEWMAYLRQHSGLPGRRANLELAQVVADEGDETMFETLLSAEEEYLVMCGAIGLGRRRRHRAPSPVAEPRCRPAVELCSRITDSLAARPPDERRSDGVRALRKALGYCWSVAVAADPSNGLPRFLALSQSSDPDVVWIVRENATKARLMAVLPD